MKNILIVLVFMLLGGSVAAQTVAKNNFFASFSNVSGNKWAGGNFVGNGFTLGYSRYFAERFYGDVTYGQLDYTGRNSVFWLPKEETGNFDMNFLTLGVGYDLIQGKGFILSSEAVFVRFSNSYLLYQVGDGDNIQIRETGRISDITARLGLKARIFLSDQLQLIPSIDYGFQIQRYETLWLNVGFGYSF